jgi:hypothetical protein
MEMLRNLRHHLDGLGLAALGLIVAAAAFDVLLLERLQARNGEVQARLARQGPGGPASGPGDAGYKVTKVYAFLQKDEATTDWLAKLHGIGAATGVQLKSASYRSEKTAGRISRYEISLPLAGSYPQIREFMQRALAEIPVMSVDQLKLKRESRDDSALQAELRLTLHLVK